MADEGLVAAIRQLLEDSPFHGEGYRKLWARLRFAGIRTSRRRVLRLMRENRLLAHQRAGRPHGSRAHDGTIITEQVDVMWGTDLTSVMTGEGQAAVFITVDHCSAECVGIHASRSADRFQALEPVKQAARQCHGGFAKGIAAGLRLRHDHGSQYVSHDFQAEIRFFGIESSPAFVREPEGNGCAERFIRVLKEHLFVGPPLRHRRGVALGTPRLPADLQPVLDHRAARLQDTRSGPGRADHGPADGRVSAERCLRTVDRYNRTQLGAFPVPVVALDMQHRIVDRLNRAAGIRRLREEALEKARAVVPALFLDMFGDPVANPRGWPDAVLGDVIKFGPQNGLYRPASEYGDGVRILRIDSFEDGGITDPASLKRLRAHTDVVAHYGLVAGDIVINRVNSPPQLGKSALIPDLDEPLVFEFEHDAVAGRYPPPSTRSDGNGSPARTRAAGADPQRQTRHQPVEHQPG